MTIVTGVIIDRLKIFRCDRNVKTISIRDGRKQARARARARTFFAYLQRRKINSTICTSASFPAFEIPSESREDGTSYGRSLAQMRRD